MTTLEIDYVVGDVVKVENDNGEIVNGYIVGVEPATYLNDDLYVVAINENSEENIVCTRYEFS